jgi:hypothetical protein
VTELLESLGNIAIYIALIGALLWSLHFAFGSQVLGLPAMLGVFVVIAGVKIFGNSGIGGLVAVVFGLAAIVVVIGMAMTVGSGRPPRRESERPPDER